MDSILIEIPSHIENDEELASWLMEDADMISGALDLDQSDDRATIDDVRITEIEIDEQTIAIHYEYDYSVYSGCRDQNYSRTAEDFLIVGKRQGNIITFDRFKPRERRSTYDEF